MGPRPDERGSQARTRPDVTPAALEPGWRPRAVLFDLLTALLDSWSLWDRIAGNAADGRRWRAEYLRITYNEGRYRPYECLVREAAVSTGLPPGFAEDLAARYAELQSWPEVQEVLRPLAGRVKLGVVTNCSERLGNIAAQCVGIPFDIVITAEAAGWYKPCPQPYRRGLERLGATPGECLFVAGSAYDLVGAAGVGMPVFWHDRMGMPMPPDAPPPLWHEARLHRLREIVLPAG